MTSGRILSASTFLRSSMIYLFPVDLAPFLISRISSPCCILFSFLKNIIIIQHTIHSTHPFSSNLHCIPLSIALEVSFVTSKYCTIVPPMGKHPYLDLELPVHLLCIRNVRNSRGREVTYCSKLHGTI